MKKLLTNLFTSIQRTAPKPSEDENALVENEQENALTAYQLEERVLYSATPIDFAEIQHEAAEVAEPVEVEISIQDLEATSSALLTQEMLDSIDAEVAPEDFSIADESYEAEAERLELILIDSRLDDVEKLIDGIATSEGSRVQYFLLEDNRDGIEQISELLEAYDNVDAIHLVSHGTAGNVFLGNSTLNDETLNAVGDDGYAQEIAQWQDSLSDNADILFYGCDLAASESGRDLIESLSELTQADIAASDDLTGYEYLGGDWDLEVTVGKVETAVAFEESFQSSWEHVLSSIETTPAQPVDALGGNQSISDSTAAGHKSVAIAPNGDYVVVWAEQISSDWEIKARLFDQYGDERDLSETQGAFTINDNSIGNQTQARVDIADNGDFVVTWTDGSNVFYRQINADGSFKDINGDQNVSPGGLSGIVHDNPDIAVNSKGDFTIAWERTPIAGDSQVVVQTFDSDGNVLLAQEAVFSNGSEPLENPSVGIDENANAVVAWQVDSDFVRAAHIKTSGTNDVDFLVWDRSGFVGQVNFPAVDMNSDGTFAITFSDEIFNATVATYVYGTGDSIPVNDGDAYFSTNGAQDDAYNSIAYFDDGSYVVAWRNDVGGAKNILVQRHNADGSVFNDAEPIAVTTSGTAEATGIAALDKSNFVVTWTDGGVIYQRQFGDLPAPLVVTNTNDLVNAGVSSVSDLLGNGGGADGVSFREAILAFNASGTGGTIRFDLPTNDYRILLDDVLPDITVPVFIDGWSQSGFVSTPIVEIDGSNVANGEEGITLSGGDSTIRGLSLVNFPFHGIFLTGNGNNTLQGNYIGVAADGSAEGNDGDGIHIDNSSDNNLIGGVSAGEGNTIANSGKDGVNVATGEGNQIRRNSIYANGELGIDLNDDGPTANDASDADDGANELLNTPEIFKAVLSESGDLVVSGYVEVREGFSYDLEFFVSQPGEDQARQFIGHGTGIASDQDFLNFRFVLPGTFTAGDIVTATTTDENNNTSEIGVGIPISNIGPTILLSTSGDENSSAVLGLESWKDDEVLEFGAPDSNTQPGFTLGENTTDGTFSSAFELSDFGSDVNINGMHYVNSDVPVRVGNAGPGPDGFDLMEGDVLLTFNEGGTHTFTGNTTSIDVQNSDVFVFRPDRIGDYSSGEFHYLLDGVAGFNIRGISLVESAAGVTIGDGTPLQQGTFLFSTAGQNFHDNIYMVTPDTVGDSNTNGAPPVLLIDGQVGDLEFSHQIQGIHVIESAQSIGGVALAAGDLLVTLNQDDNAVGGGSPQLSTEQQDIFVLRMSNTQTGPTSTSNGVAFTLLDGSDLGLSGGQEDIDALTIIGADANTAPVATDDTYTIDEDTTLDLAGSWSLADWQARRQLTLDSSNITTDLVDFPVLVELDSTRIDYAKTLADGADLRFTDTDGNALSFEVEKWDPAGTSHVWVKVPLLSATGGNSIFMYYDNASAVPPTNLTADVWSNGFDATWHLGIDGTNGVADSTGNYDGTGVDVSNVTGLAGDALDFNSGISAVDLGTNIDLTNSDSQLTFNAWINSDNPTTASQNLFSNSIDGADSSRFSVEIRNGKIAVILRTDDTGGPFYGLTTVNSVIAAPGQWHNVTVTVDLSIDALDFNDPLDPGNPNKIGPVRVFVDGVVQETEPDVASVPALSETSFPSTNSQTSLIGRNETGGQGFDGRIDELRIANVVRSEEWIRAQYDSWNDSLVSFSDELSIDGILGNDVDPENDGLTATVVPLTGPANAQSFTLNTNGSFVYVPNEHFNGLDTFTYTVTDAGGLTDVATVSISVTPVNDAPEGDVTITGDAIVGEMLTASNDLDDIDGLGSITYHWVRNGVDIATGSTYEVAAADVGFPITVEARYTDGDNTDESEASPATANVVARPAVSLGVVTGSVLETVTAQTKIADINVSNLLGDPELTLSGSDAGLFTIIGNELILVANPGLDFETNNSLDVTVNLNDLSVGTGIEDSQDFTLAVGDVDGDRVSLINAVDKLPEDFDTTTRTKIADIELFIDDTSASTMLMLQGADKDLFEIDGTGLFLKAGVSLDAETQGELDVRVELSDVPTSTVPVFTDTATELNFDTFGTIYPGGPNNDFAAIYEGDFEVATAGTYTFHLTSDDGSVLFINGERVIDMSGTQSSATEQVSLDLAAGTHEIEVRYFDDLGRAELDLDWEGPGFGLTQMLFPLGLEANYFDSDGARDVFDIDWGTQPITLATATHVLCIENLNEAPTIDLDVDDSSGTGGSDLAVNFTAGDSAVSLVDGPLVADVDSVIQSLTATITNVQDGTAETLDIPVMPATVSSSYDSGTGTLTITNLGSATNADFQAALGLLTYVNNSTTPDLTARVIEIFAHDGEVDSNIAIATVNMTGDEAAPAENKNAGSSVDEGGEDVIESSELDFTDLQPVEDLTYTVTSVSSNGFLALASDKATAITSFTQADIDAGVVVYIHDGSETTSDSFTFTIDDGLGNELTGQIFNITVVPQNDAPVNSVPGTQVTSEDGSLTFDASNGNLISIADPDAATDPVNVRLTVANGRLDLNGVAGLTFTIGDGIDDSTMNFRGTVAAINAALNGLVYRPTENYNGSDALTVLASDIGNNGAGGFKTDFDTVAINVAAVNDAPDVKNPVAAYTVDEQTNLNIHGTGFSVTDVDVAIGTMTATLSVGEGDIALAIGDSGVSIGTNNASTVSFTGTLVQINALLEGTSSGSIVYNNDNDAPVSSTTIMLTVNDGGNTGTDPNLTGDNASEEGSASQTINILPVNDPATFSGDKTGAVTEDVDPNLDTVLETVGTLTVNDPDAGESAMLAGTFTGDYGVLAVDASGSWTYTADNTQAAIQNLDITESLSDTFTVTSIDGSEQDIVVTIHGAEDAPTVDNAIADQTATQDTPYTHTFAANTFGDVDTSDVLTYSARLSSGGTLPGWLNFNPATRTLSGTPANADVGTINVEVIATDGSSSVSTLFDLKVVNINDPATFAGDDTGAVTEDVDPNMDTVLETGGTLTVNDPDAGQSTIQAGTFTGVYGSLVIDASGVWTYSADNTQPAIQNLDVGESRSDTFTVASIDGSETDIVITIHGAEDAPTVDNAIANHTVTQDTPYTHAFAINTFGDIDTSDSLTYSAQLAGGGTLPGWLNFDPATRTFSGTPANADVGTINVEVIATDGSTNVSDFFDLSVVNINDPATFAGNDTGNVTEDVDPNMDTVLETSGTLIVNDPDVGQSIIQGGTFTGVYGSLVIDASGSWTYSADNTQAAIQSLDVGESRSDTFTVASIDGSETDIIITISGAEDAPTVDNAISNQTATEDTPYSYTCGTNTFGDVDTSDTLTFTAQLAGGGALPGWLNFDPASRTFSGTPTNTDVGTIIVEVIANDGTSSVSDFFDLSVVNTNDAATFGGDVTGSVTEDVDPDADSLLETGGTLIVNDPDVGESTVQPVTLTGTYGNLTIDAAGDWTYSADNTQVAIQNLDVGESRSDTFTVASLDGSETDIVITIHGAEDAPTVDNAIPSHTATEDAFYSYTFATDTFGDVDTSDTLTYSAQLAGGGALPSWLNFDATTRTFSGTPANADVGTINVEVIANDGTSSVSDFFNLGIINTNDAASFSGDDRGSVTEDVDPDADSLLEIGGTLTVNDPDVGESTIVPGTFTGTYGNLTIDASGDWIYSADNTQTAIQQLDALDSLTETFTVSSVDGSLHDIVVTIDGAEDAPINSVPDPQTTNEDSPLTFSSANGNLISVSDVDTGTNPIEVTLSVTSGTLDLAPAAGVTFSAGDGVADSTMTFQGTVADINAALDGLTYQSAPDYNGSDSLTITTSDLGNGGGTALIDTDTVAITVDPVNDAPTGPVDFTGPLYKGEELTASNSLNDIDGLGPITYQWMRDGAAIAGADQPTYTLVQDDVGTTIQVEARYTDSDGTDEAVISLGEVINDLPLVSLINRTPSVPEDTTAQTKIADIVITDATPNSVLGLAGADAGLFQIIGNELYLRANPTLNFEADTELDVTVTVDDPTLGTAIEDSVAYTLGITDINEAPTVSIVNTTDTIDENTQLLNRMKVADVQVDDDALGVNILSLSGSDAGLFEIDGTELFLRQGTGIDFESNPVLDVTVEVNDPTIGVSFEDSDSHSINVVDVNEAPSVQLTNRVTDIDENTTVQTKIADIEVTDDALGTANLSIAGPDAGLFEIIGTELFLKAGQDIDFEARTAISVTVHVDDPLLGTTNDDADFFNIDVNDVNEEPTVKLINQLPSVPEDTNSQTKVADIVVTDDALGSEDLTLSGLDAGLFEIVGFELYLKANSGLDFESSIELDVTVSVDDPNLGSGAEDAASMILGVTDVNEAPQVANPLADVNATEDDPDLVIDLSNVFEDVDLDTLDLGVASNSDPSIASVQITGNSLEIDFVDDQSGNFSVDIVASDGEFTATDTINVNVAPDNDAPILDGDAVLADIYRDANPDGETVRDLVDSLVKDIDAGDSLGGIAIIENSAPLNEGRWQYLDATSSWNDVGLANKSSAVALSADTIIRFLPATGFDGTPASLEFIAIDSSYSGSFSDASVVQIDASQSGETAPFSIDSSKLGISVKPFGFLVTPTSSNFTSESGKVATFEVVLQGAPTGDVVITIASDDSSEGIATTKELVFTSSDWAKPQTVEVIGVDDSVDDDDQNFSIVLGSATSSDPIYDGLNADDIEYTNVDDDTAGIYVSETKIQTSESGQSDEFSVKLKSQPTGVVRVDVTVSDPAEAAASSSFIEFTPSNWNVLQTVTVTGANDNVADGTATQFSVAVTPNSTADAKFDALDSTSIEAENISVGTTITTPDPISVPDPDPVDEVENTVNTEETDEEENTSTEQPLGAFTLPEKRIGANDLARKASEIIDPGSGFKGGVALKSQFSSSSYYREINSTESLNDLYVEAKQLSEEAAQLVRLEEEEGKLNGLWGDLDSLENQIDNQSSLPQIAAGTMASIASVFTAGYLVWLIRGGQILLGLVTQLPAWSSLDMLTVLSTNDEEEDEDSESLESIVSNTDESNSQQESESTSEAASQNKTKTTSSVQ